MRQLLPCANSADDWCHGLWLKLCKVEVIDIIRVKFNVTVNNV